MPEFQESASRGTVDKDVISKSPNSLCSTLHSNPVALQDSVADVAPFGAADAAIDASTMGHPSKRPRPHQLFDLLTDVECNDESDQRSKCEATSVNTPTLLTRKHSFWDDENKEECIAPIQNSTEQTNNGGQFSSLPFAGFARRSASVVYAPPTTFEILNHPNTNHANMQHQQMMGLIEPLYLQQQRVTFAHNPYIDAYPLAGRGGAHADLQLYQNGTSFHIPFNPTVVANNPMVQDVTSGFLQIPSGSAHDEFGAQEVRPDESAPVDTNEVQNLGPGQNDSYSFIDLLHGKKGKEDASQEQVSDEITNGTHQTATVNGPSDYEILAYRHACETVGLQPRQDMTHGSQTMASNNHEIAAAYAAAAYEQAAYHASADPRLYDPRSVTTHYDSNGNAFVSLKDMDQEESSFINPGDMFGSSLMGEPMSSGLHHSCAEELNHLRHKQMEYGSFYASEPNHYGKPMDISHFVPNTSGKKRPRALGTNTSKHETDSTALTQEQKLHDATTAKAGKSLTAASIVRQLAMQNRVANDKIPSNGEFHASQVDDFLTSSPYQHLDLNDPSNGIAKLYVPIKRKKHVCKACIHCKKAHLACDEERPCRRCVHLGKIDCVDVEHKRRGRPKMAPEKRRSNNTVPPSASSNAKTNATQTLTNLQPVPLATALGHAPLMKRHWNGIQPAPPTLHPMPHPQLYLPQHTLHMATPLAPALPHAIQHLPHYNGVNVTAPHGNYDWTLAFGSDTMQRMQAEQHPIAASYNSTD